jgi:plastocyanin
MKRSILATSAVLMVVIPTLVLATGCGRDEDGPRGAATGAMPPAATVVVAALPTSDEPVDGAASVLVSGMRFLPEVVRVRAGQSVAWTFNDPGVLHSVTAFDGFFDSGVRSSGTFVVRFDRPGTYCYQCQPHPGRNLCEQASGATATPLLLAARPVKAVPSLLDRLGGGGHMQGKVIVEE